jgi:hypothetical protein
MKDNLDFNLLDFNKKIDKLIELGKRNQVTNSKRFYFKIFLNGLINRSINIGRGYINLLKDDNFIAAAPLVRVQLDSLLRLFAGSIVEEDCNDFAKEVYNGKSIRNMKDRDNQKMFDGYLAKRISRENGFEWVEKVYGQGNGYIHYSDQTIFSSTKLDAKKQQVKMISGPSDYFVTTKEKCDATQLMIIITEAIRQLISAFLEVEKNNTRNT